MDIKFVANEVSYRDAMDGDIKQLSFAEDEDDDPLNPSKYYLQLSVNNEFPPFSPSVEWFDGRKYDGGADVSRYHLERNVLRIWLDNNAKFTITFDVNDSVYECVSGFFSDLL